MYVCLIFFVNVFHLTEIILETRLINKKSKIVLIILKSDPLCFVPHDSLRSSFQLSAKKVPSTEIYICWEDNLSQNGRDAVTPHRWVFSGRFHC